MDFVKTVRKLRAKPTDSFVVHLNSNEPERTRDYINEMRKVMPEGWRGTIICLGPNESLDSLSMPAVRELNLRLKSMLDQEDASEVVQGQIWESKDKRDKNSRIEIIQVTSTQVFAKHLNTGKKTIIKLESFKGGKRGAAYKLVRDGI